MPVSSYAPEFLEVFKRAAQKEFVIPLGLDKDGKPKRATHMRYRLNMLRRDMRKEQHSLTTIANSVQFILMPNGDLKCSPADTCFLSELKEAGIVVPTPGDLPNVEVPLAKSERAEAEEALSQFLKSGEKK